MSFDAVTYTLSPMTNLFTLGMGAGVIVRVTGAVCISEPEAPVMVIGYDPVGAVREAERVRMLVQAGVQEAGENDALTPAGRPDTEKDTEADVPDVRDAVMVSETLCPCTTDTEAGEGDREKSNAGGGGGVTAKVMADTDVD